MAINWKSILRITPKLTINEFDLVEEEYKNFREQVNEQINEKGLDYYNEISDNQINTNDFYPVTTSIITPSNKFKNSIAVISDYYLYRMEKYWEVEGIFFRIINKMIELLMEEGFTFYSEITDNIGKYTNELSKVLRNSNPKYNDYSLMRRISHDVCLYGNCFIQLLRDNDRVIGIRIHDPLAIKILQHKDTQAILGYTQINGLRKRGDLDKQLKKPTHHNKIVEKYLRYMPKVFYLTTNKHETPIKYEDMIHIKYIDAPQTAMSIPPLYTILDDLLTLRSIEDDIALLSYQYGHPFLHATIEREKLTQEQIRQECIYLGEQITKVEGNGFLVTSDRVKIEMITASGTLPDLAKFHALFSERINKGSGIPDSFIGDGGGLQRQSSEVVKGSVYSFINDVGKTIAGQLQEKLVDEIYNRNCKKIYTDVSFISSGILIKFYDADATEVRATEQHATVLWQGGGITHGEYRTLLKKPIDTKLKDKYFTDIQHEQNKELQSQGESAALEQTAVSAKIKSQQTPSNQHGKKTKSGSVKNNIEEDENLNDK